MSHESLSGLDSGILKMMNKQRLKSYPVLLMIGFLMYYGMLSLRTDSLFHPESGVIIWQDFLAFWSASWLVINDSAMSVYKSCGAEFAMTVQGACVDYHTAHMQVPGMSMDKLPSLPFPYPPNTLLMFSPFASVPVETYGALSYVAGYLMLIIPTLALMIWMMVRMVGHRLAALWSFAVKDVWVVLYQGQSGFIGAGAMGMFVHWLYTRPILAGLALALLAYKPLWGIIIPFALLIDRRWPTIITATIALALWCGAATFVYGIEIWGAWLTFIQNTFLQDFVIKGNVGGAEMNSLAGTLKAVGVSHGWQTVLWWIYMPITVLAVCWLWWKKQRGEAGQDGALIALVAGTCFAQHYILPHDMVLLLPAGALLLRAGLDRGFHKHEVSVLAFCILFAPLNATLDNIDIFVALLTGVKVSWNIQLGWLMPLFLLIAGINRALAEPGQGHQVDAPTTRKA